MRIDRLPLLRGLAVLAAVALLASLAAACGGDGGGGETPQADETPAAGETPTAGGDEGEDGEDGGGGGDEGLGDLEALAGEAAEGVVAKITYAFTSDVGGEVTGGEWVLVQRPPDSRFEVSTEEGGESVRTIVINSGGKSYLCVAGGGEETCLATTAEQAGAQTALLDPLFDVPREISEDVAGVDLIDRSEREIAGLDATCFTVAGGLVGPGEAETCFSADGLLLFLRSETNGDSFTFEATSVSTDVTDEDFEPPYDIWELPTDFDLEGQ